MIFIDAVAAFAILASIWFGCVVITETFKMPLAMRFFAEPQAGSDLRKCIVVIVVSALWLIFGSD